MLESYFSKLSDDTKIPIVLVVGCGRVGQEFVKTFVDQAPHGSTYFYVTDSDKDKARKLSEYRLSAIEPIRWRSAHDTPDDVDVIVVAVDHDNEHKIIDRLALSNKPFVSLSDDASVFDSYEEYEEDFIQSGIRGIVGTGLVPGASNVLVQHCVSDFDRVLDIVVERLGFVSSSSLSSLKSARRESTLSVRDGIITDSRRKAGSSLSWFPPPYELTDCQSVATGVLALTKTYPKVHNITVRFAEPKLPTFSERVRSIVLKIPLTTTRACIRVEVHGLRNGEFQTLVRAVVGDALKIIIQTSIMAVLGLHNLEQKQEIKSPFLNCDDVIDAKALLYEIHESGGKIYQFDGIDI